GVERNEGLRSDLRSWLEGRDSTIDIMKRIRSVATSVVFLLLAAPLFAQQAGPNSNIVTLDTLLNYHAKGLGPVQWQADGKGYLMLESSPANKDVVEIIRY